MRRGFVNTELAETLNNKNNSIEILVDNWEDLVADPEELEDWEKIVDNDLILIVPETPAEPSDEELDEQYYQNLYAAERANRQRVEEHEAAWVARHKKEQIKLPKLERKTWKSINQYKGNVSSAGIVKMIYQRGMTNRWTKKYKKNFPTWHAIGRKWQGQLDGFVNDFVKKLKQQKFKLSGKYDDDFWVDDILRVASNILPTVLKRHHKHVSVILNSMLHDRERLDKNFKELHAGLPA